MINVLILEGLSPLKCEESPLNAGMCEVFSASLSSALRTKGIVCRTIRPDGIENDYFISGRTDRSIIYAPVFTDGEVSFIHTDSTNKESISYRIACGIRDMRDGITFIGALAEGDRLLKFSPVILDEIAAGTDDKVCPYSIALSTAGVLSEFLANQV